jgi:SET domain-containing protein
MLLVKSRLATSEIHGIGLFADEFIAQGTITWRFVEGFDLRLTQATIDALSDSAKQQVLKYGYFDERLGLYELCSDDARFFNHADTPNTRSFVTDSGDEVDVAVRDIGVGEELTCDYSFFDRDWRTKLGRG